MSKSTRIRLLAAVVAVMWLAASQTIQAQFRARDPGVRGGPAGAGDPFPDLTGDEQTMFDVGKDDFSEEEEVDEGVGPRFNFVSCAGCHIHPAVGGTSPGPEHGGNPLFRVTDPSTTDFLGFDVGNVMPSFIRRDGPIREARFKYNRDGSRDGGVHALFVIAGHEDAPGCNIKQEDFETQVANRNIIFRIPTPTFGSGLIENIPDRAILANLAANSLIKRNLGIRGRPNRNGNDGRISRFGWKAQNQSLLIFSAEAYNVEMGITSEGFQIERDETAGCQFTATPNDVTPSVGQIGAIENFANFQRFLAPPTPVASYGDVSAESVTRGRQVFMSVGCALCHTPTLKTGFTTVQALREKDVNLYSDLVLHRMGPGLADDILQGVAQGDEFRTSPLWGLGQRVFFLHDGRTRDLGDAIRAHRSDGNRQFGPSEANAVVDRYNRLDERDKQHLLNFLRSL